MNEIELLDMEILFTAKLIKVVMVVSTLYTKLLHDDLKFELSSIDNFALRGETKLLLDCLDWCSILGEENKRRLGFSKTSLKTAINYLIENCNRHPNED